MEVTAGITVQHRRTRAGNYRAGQRDQPSGLRDNAAQGAETRICQPARDGQGAAVEREPVGIVPRKDRVEVPGPGPGLRLAPVLVLIGVAAVVAQLDLEVAPELIPQFVPRPAPELIPELAVELTLDLPPQLVPELAAERAVKPPAELVLELAAELPPQPLRDGLRAGPGSGPRA